MGQIAEFQPTDAQRKQVHTMAGVGVPHDQIAVALDPPIDPKTLRKHFRRELDLGEANATAAVAQTLFQMATGRAAKYDAEGRKVQSEATPQLGAAIFWMKARAGWRENIRVEMQKLPSIDADKLTDEELDTLIALLKKAEITDGDPAA